MCSSYQGLLTVSGRGVPGPGSAYYIEGTALILYVFSKRRGTAIFHVVMEIKVVIVMAHLFFCRQLFCIYAHLSNAPQHFVISAKNYVVDGTWRSIEAGHLS